MAVHNLLQALNTPNEPRLVQFVTALGQIGPTATNALLALLKLLSDSNEGVRRCATNALKRIDPEAARRAGIK